MSAQSAELMQAEYCDPNPVGPLQMGVPLGCGTQWLPGPQITDGLSGAQVPPLPDELDELLDELLDEDALLEDALLEEAEELLEELLPAGWQIPPLQFSPSRQSMPQSPQLVGSADTSMQTPPHFFIGKLQGAPPLPLEVELWPPLLLVLPPPPTTPAPAPPSPSSPKPPAVAQAAATTTKESQAYFICPPEGV